MIKKEGLDKAIRSIGYMRGLRYLANIEWIVIKLFLLISSLVLTASGQGNFNKTIVCILISQIGFLLFSPWFEKLVYFDEENMKNLLSSLFALLFTLIYFAGIYFFINGLFHLKAIS